MLSVDERFELLKYTVNACSSDILNMSDHDVKYTLFEELPVDMDGFLRNSVLDILISEGYIDENIYNKCSELRKNYMASEENMKELSDINKIKSSYELGQIMNLADDILSCLAAEAV